MIFIILLVAIALIAIVAFCTWFLSMKADGKCPICAIKHLGGSKLTIDVSKDDNYSIDEEINPPLMGWSSWNTLRNHIDEDTILEVADAIRATGLAEAGYKYINLDDCWQSSFRDSDGKLQGDLETFPSGIDTLCKNINSRGLKLSLIHI